MEASRVQFIEQTFADFFTRLDQRGKFAEIAGGHSALLGWIHDRLFLQNKTVSAVRAELNGMSQSVRVVAVTSGKGGVGKTTFAVNLAIAFAQQKRRVLLFDADLGMANVHVFAGVTPAATLLDVIDGRTSLASILAVGPAGIQTACGASGVARLADLSGAALERLGRELMRVASDFDVLVIDTGAGIAASTTQFLGLAQDAIVISTPNLASTLDAYGVIKVAHESQLATRMHVLVNQAEDASQAALVLSRIVGCASRFLQSTPGDLGFLHRDAAFENANQNRRPLLLDQPENPNAQHIAKIAARLVDSAPSLITAQSQNHTSPATIAA